MINAGAFIVVAHRITNDKPVEFAPAGLDKFLDDVVAVRAGAEIGEQVNVSVAGSWSGTPRSVEIASDQTFERPQNDVLSMLGCSDVLLLPPCYEIAAVVIKVVLWFLYKKASSCLTYALVIIDAVH